MSEKPFAPTAQRLRRARVEGNPAKAQELATLLSFTGVAFVLVSNMPRLAESAAGCFIEAVAFLAHRGVPDRIAPSTYFPYVMTFAEYIIAALGTGSLLSCAVAFSATRGALTPVTLNFGRIAPAEHMKQLFSPATLTAFIRALASAAIAAGLLVPIAISMTAASLGLPSIRELTAQVWLHIVQVLALLAGIGLVTAGAEVVVTLRKRRAKLRMTHEEIRREAKEQQGDPHLRLARRRRQRSFARGGAAAVRRATVIITNPTRLAIALLYAPPRVGVPLVVARAADAAAAEIRRVAQSAAVPCIEHVALARTLWARCEEGDPVPPETFAILAPIIAALTRESSS
jgi:flagellar biosynthesis protein FlhB